jgi:N-acetylneuraminic acid mutarotase
MRKGAFRATATLLVVGALCVSACSGAATPSAPPTAATSASVPQPSSTTTASTTTTPSAAPSVGTWAVTGSMITARAEFTATLLPYGKVLVAGGIPDNTEQVQLASAELYDPSTGKWSATGSMLTPRSKHTATLLANGKVLVAGGFCAPLGPGGGATKGCPAVEDPDGAIANAELYDPATGKWTATGSMSTARFLHTATLLADGSVLVAGAEHRDGILASAELYNPATGKWTATTSMITARTQQFAAKLADGNVLIAGGIGPVSPTDHGALTSAEVYDPATRKWAATGELHAAHVQIGTIALLRDGKVLLAGGGGSGDPMLASAELYDPSSGTWTSTASMLAPRGESASTLLADGRVFVVGGFSDPSVPNAPLLASAELFDPKTGSWIDAGGMSAGHFDLTVTLLANGQVLVTGGLDPDGVTASTELYDPGPK